MCACVHTFVFGSQNRISKAISGGAGFYSCVHCESFCILRGLQRWLVKDNTALCGICLDYLCDWRLQPLTCSRNTLWTEIKSQTKFRRIKRCFCFPNVRAKTTSVHTFFCALLWRKVLKLAAKREQDVRSLRAACKGTSMEIGLTDKFAVGYSFACNELFWCDHSRVNPHWIKKTTTKLKRNENKDKNKNTTLSFAIFFLPLTAESAVN